MAVNKRASSRWVYSFDKSIKTLPGRDATERQNLLGGKSAHLMEMCRLSLPVPPGFTISTDACNYYLEKKSAYPKELPGQIAAALKSLEKSTGKIFGDAKNPLLVSVRSGARVSMPGMMDTVLNLGLNDQTVQGLISASGNKRFAYDCYRRFIQMYSNVVLDVRHHEFEDVLDRHKSALGAARDTDLTDTNLQAVIKEYLELVRKKTGRDFPQNARDQLMGAIGAVFDSWNNDRAKTYRRIHNIPEQWGTAVTVQSMVFGNLGDDCATGVCFTRNPSTGENIFYGEYLINAQGEDVVAGIRTPQPILKDKSQPGQSMQETMPRVYAELARVRTLLERHYKDMQDIEFTIERGKLYMLQTRSGKRTAAAAIKIAVDMVSEKIIGRDEAVRRIDPKSIDQLLHPRLDPKADRVILTRGLPASPGAASGILSFSADEAEELAQKGQSVILARTETSPEDIHGMHAAKGIITARGGMTSHAAVVARGMGRPCVAGASALKIDYHAGILYVAGKQLKAGDFVTIDGGTGEIMHGAVAMLQPEMTGAFATLMRWVDATRRLRVRANADTPQDAKIARNFGAEGIGLCRTEHMFFDADRIAVMREMILSSTPEQRQKALAKLLPLQRGDFEAIFREMAGLPVTIRLLDPPLHEFLPHGEKELNEVAAASGISKDQLRERANQLHEINPMLGLRGCRLGVVYPEIYEMQARAIIEAALNVKSKSGKAPIAEIMIPLITGEAEFAKMRDLVTKTANAVFAEKKSRLAYTVGSMIELPRAALRAGQLAKAGCEFFSFGTNDLTQTALGLSRDDAGSFLPEYQRTQIFEQDPFVSIDQDGVGELVRIAVERGRAADRNLKIGICGEHGGDAKSIEFFSRAGLDYVSCSPYRVPIARLAAAQAALSQGSRAHGAKSKSPRLPSSRAKKQKKKVAAKSKSPKRKAA